MKTILVTGANGQLGQCIKEATKSLNRSDYEFIFVGREELNIAKIEDITNFLSQHSFDYLINCAAYTAVDLAEEQVDLAYLINANAVGELAIACKQNDIQFIHISTDYVFDGNASQPFQSTDKTKPLGVYGKSKLKGEELAIQNNPDSIIVRTAWVYSQYGKNFLKTMLYLFKNKDEISVVDDQQGTPTNANDIARALIQIVQSDKPIPGIFHFTNSGITTWFGFANEIKKLTNSHIKIKPIPSSDYPTPAKRPKYSVLDNHKIQQVYGVKSRDWKESLAEVVPLLDN